MQGKVIFCHIPVAGHGITPAYAGKRLWCRGHGAPGQDYPRVCGEKLQTRSRKSAWTGSPPRMRGKVFSAASSSHSAGITPAYAGKRQSTGCKAENRRDHPRICGEKFHFAVRIACALGSPPHMRGKGMRYCPPRPRWWITPAYAGKRQVVVHREMEIQDHPRVCGEK